MANKIKLKQSSVSGKVPTTADLDLGELGINTYDGKLFLKQKVGVVETIIDVTGAASGVASVSGSAPIISSGGLTPAISISAATTLAAGSMSAADKTKIDAVTGTNTGDESATSIKTKLSITTLSGSNTGDQVLPIASSTAPAALGVAAVGVEGTFARADHVHLLPTLATLGAQAAGNYATGGGSATGTNTGDQTTVSGSSGYCTGSAENVVTPVAGYKHVGAWGVGRTAVGAILVNTAYVADYVSTVTAANLAGAVAPSTAGNVLTSNGSAWISADVIPAGTRLAFQQTAAPTGWTKDTTAALNNTAMRIVTGAVVNGGSVAFTTAFSSQNVTGTNGVSGATTLSITQIPSHQHTSDGTTINFGYAGGANIAPRGGAASTGLIGGGGSHTHPAGSFTGTDINLTVKYYDFIIASKQ